MKNYLECYKEKAFKKLVEAKNYTEKQLELLKSVKRVRKKDWTDFQSLWKNFACDLWTFRQQSYSDCVYLENYETSVYIKTYYNLNNEKELKEKYEKEAPERIVKEYWLVDRVFLNADEIWGEIQDKIVYYENYLKTKKEAVKNFEKVYWKIEKAYWELVKAVTEAGEDTEYTFQQMIKEAL